MAIGFLDLPLQARCLTAIIWGLYILPIIALIISVGFTADLHKCDVDFSGWMFLFIITTYFFITLTLMERYIGDDRPIAKCSGILWVAAYILLANSDKTGICRSVSIYVYNFIVFSPIILFILFLIVFIVT